MKKLILILAFSWAFIDQAIAQCGALSVSYTTTPSRCMETGSITVTVTGGSGNYNFWVTGAKSTSATSSPTITGLPAGNYTLFVSDLTLGCTRQLNAVTVAGGYTTPTFTLAATPVTCRGNDGTITTNGLTGGRAPYTYSIVAPSASGEGTTNATGYFQNLPAGEYNIQLQDSCGGIQVRHVTVNNFAWFYDRMIVTRLSCDSAAVTILLNDNSGGNNQSNPAGFTGFSYGIIRAPGDTLWFSGNSFRVPLGSGLFTAVIKDPCGAITRFNGSVPPGDLPATGAVVTSQFTCNTFTATITNKQNLTNAQFCLYDAANTVIGCNSNGVFLNLPYGSYCMRITDNCYDTTIVRCFAAAPPVPSVDATVALSNQNCNTFTATVTGQVNITNANYCLYDAGNTLITCNNTGQFNLLPYQSYCITIYDACYDTTITRCFTPVRPLPVITGVNVVADSCNAFDVDIIGDSTLGTRFCLYDNNGNAITCNSTGIFDDIAQGSYCIRAVSSCGDTTAPYCFATKMPAPTVGSVFVTNINCRYFRTSIGGQTNTTNPQYCLYDAKHVQIRCNTTGAFDSIPYGNYCIEVKDGCYDTTIVRCFSAVAPVINLNATMQQTNKTCNTFTATVTGTNFTSPQFCIFNSASVQVACNSTGVFNNLPYGAYCATVKDGCLDTTLTVCQSFDKVRGLTLSTYSTCAIGTGKVAAQTKSVNNPFTFTYYHPNGTVVYTTTTWSGYVDRDVPALPVGQEYKIVCVDACGDRDSAYIAPAATTVSRNVTITGKCPGVFANGSSNVTVVCSSPMGTVRPRLIKKDNTVISQSYNNTNGWNTYTFLDLGAGTYIMQYTLVSCNTSINDTVVVAPYAYPVNNQSAVYQCDNNGFTVTGNVSGGIGPFAYEIIGSTPSSPSIVTAPQASPLFYVNNGTAYSLVRLRAVDACGNASLSDLGVLPLQNVIISATSTCLYAATTLSVDSIPNATYSWYRKTGANDSTLIGTQRTYTIPYVTENDRGAYVCKLQVNSNCLTRLTTFDLTGVCSDVMLPNGIHLTGSGTAKGNLLQWSNSQAGITAYSVERKKPSDNTFITLANIPPRTGDYQYLDETPLTGDNVYRLRMTGETGTILYSNTVLVRNHGIDIRVSPNPAQETFTVYINGKQRSNYDISLLSMTGRMLVRKQVQQQASAAVNFNARALAGGTYLVKVVNSATGETNTLKVIVR